MPIGLGQIEKGKQMYNDIQKLKKTKVSKFTADVGNAFDNSFIIEHGLETRDVTVSIYENKEPYNLVFADVQLTTENAISITFGKVADINQFKVVIIG